ncbi:hypothetical protein WKH56_20340 [Priestia sp. SB1]|uniref:hypothetical protein n=1 Tax=Priestia sp. SB1 TaxID=3132359 RepID=UPI00317C7E03
MEAIRVKAYSMWNTSISTLFGKSPKVKMMCGNCEYVFSKRFEPIHFYKGYPKTLCPSCSRLNYVPIVVNNEE